MKKTQKGFTLVELLVVIAILAILATVSVVGYTSFIDRANQSNSDTEAHQIETAIESALIIPNEVFEIVPSALYAKMNGSNVELWANAECTTVVTATEFALSGDDFGGLQGKLKIEGTKLVYYYNTEIHSDVIDIILGAAAANP